MPESTVYIVGKTGCLQAGVPFKEGAEITFKTPLTDAKAAKLGLTLKTEKAAAKEPIKGSNTPQTTQPSMTVAELTEHISKIDNRVEINLLKKGETRKGALDAIEARIKELED